MKNFLLTCFCIGLLLAAFPAGAQTIATSSSIVSLTNNSGRIGISLQPGTASESDTLWTLKAGEYFSISCGTLRCSSAFSGKLAVILLRNSTELVAILAQQSISFQSATIGSVYFDCRLSEGIDVLDGDVICLATTTDNENYNLVRGGSTDVTSQVPATNYAIPFYKINMPDDVEGVTIRIGDTNLYPDKVVRGRSFFFYVEPDKSEMELIVRANTETLAPSSSGMYTIDYVLEDYDVEIKVYDLSTAKTFQKLTLSESVRISDLLTQDEMYCTTYLVIDGEMKDEDFYTIRDYMALLETLDLSQAVAENNYVPDYAFNYNVSISKLFLPLGIEGFGNDCFREMAKLENIILPENCCHFGLNEFFGCPKLNTVWVKWNPFEHGSSIGFTIPPCAFRGTSYDTEGTLIVPVGCVEAYRNAENWGNWYNIREPYPIDDLLLDNGEITVEEQPLRVTAEKGAIVLGVAGGMEPVWMAIYNLNGSMLYGAIVREETRIPLPAGFYIVSTGNKSEKIIIR